MRFFNRIYDSWRDIQTEKYRHIVERIGISVFEDKLIVDAGASTGFLFDFFRECKLNVRMICTDIDKVSIKHNKCEFKLVCDVQRMPFKKHVFDIMFCIDVLHLLESLDTSLLKQNGILILGVIKKHEEKFDNFIKSARSEFKVLDIFEIKGREEEKVAILMKL
jgi:ubiquinone/menaquinone biosynthesis C-methylase UbiE